MCLRTITPPQRPQAQQPGAHTGISTCTHLYPQGADTSTPNAHTYTPMCIHQDTLRATQATRGPMECTHGHDLPYMQSAPFPATGCRRTANMHSCSPVRPPTPGLTSQADGCVRSHGPPTQLLRAASRQPSGVTPLPTMTVGMAMPQAQPPTQLTRAPAPAQTRAHTPSHGASPWPASAAGSHGIGSDPSL